MNRYNTIIVLMAAVLMQSCAGNNTSSTLPEGKVKLESIGVASKIAGRIEKIYVQEGQQVNKGDTLAIIYVPELTAKMEQANGAVTAAEGQLLLAHNGATKDQLDQIQSQLDAAEAQLSFAKVSFSRIQNMFNDSLVPAQQYDEVKSKYEAAQAQVKAIKAKQKEVLAGTRTETVTSARGQVERAKGARSEVLQAEKETIILAPDNMLVEGITLKEGELVTPGYTIFNGYLQYKTYFRFTIGERAVNAYPLGSPVTVSVPGINKEIPAKITMVKQLPRYADNTSTAPNREVGEGFFELKIVPTDEATATGLYNNSTVFLK